MILVTGAAGKTGRAVLKALAHFHIDARALARNQEEAGVLEKGEAKEIFIGNLRDDKAMLEATRQVEMVYLICPNVVPDELEIGKRLLAAAKRNGVRRVVYHSVLHPQVEAMPHHWQKMRVEEAIFQAGIDFTILQPCAYMQNILAGWDFIVQYGIYSIPYSTSARISIVDLEDVGMAAGLVIKNSGHENAIYELAGPEPLTQDEVAGILGKELNRDVRAVSQNRGDWSKRAKGGKMNDYARQTLLKMFEYYDQFGLIGNPRTLETILCRPATTFTDFVRREMKARTNL